MTQNARLEPVRLSTRVGWRRWHAVGLTAVSAYSAALGWQAQVLSYPLFAAVSQDDSAAYHPQYNAAIPVVVIVPGFVTFLAGRAFSWTRPLTCPARWPRWWERRDSPRCSPRCCGPSRCTTASIARGSPTPSSRV